MKLILALFARDPLNELDCWLIGVPTSARDYSRASESFFTVRVRHDGDRRPRSILGQMSDSEKSEAQNPEEGNDQEGEGSRSLAAREETFLARTGQEIGASLIVGIMNKVPTRPAPLFVVIPVAYTRAPVRVVIPSGFSSSPSLSQ